MVNDGDLRAQCDRKQTRLEASLSRKQPGGDGFDGLRGEGSVCFQNLEGATGGANQQSSIMPGVSGDPASLCHFINDPRESPTVPSSEPQTVPDWEA